MFTYRVAPPVCPTATFPTLPIAKTPVLAGTVAGLGLKVWTWFEVVVVVTVETGAVVWVAVVWVGSVVATDVRVVVVWVGTVVAVVDAAPVMETQTRVKSTSTPIAFRTFIIVQLLVR